jgi:hypothetical protein
MPSSSTAFGSSQRSAGLGPGCEVAPLSHSAPPSEAYASGFGEVVHTVMSLSTSCFVYRRRVTTNVVSFGWWHHGLPRTPVWR